MLQADKPDDFVLATNETHTVRKFVELAFKEVGHDHHVEGTRRAEWTRWASTQDGKVVVRIDPKYYRPTEVELLLGDSRKAEKCAGLEGHHATHSHWSRRWSSQTSRQCEEKNLKW